MSIHEMSNTNDNFERMNDLIERHDCEYDCGIDEVLVGNGTLKGFVFLQEELLSEQSKGETL